MSDLFMVIVLNLVIVFLGVSLYLTVLMLLIRSKKIKLFIGLTIIGYILYFLMDPILANNFEDLNPRDIYSSYKDLDYMYSVNITLGDTYKFIKNVFLFPIIWVPVALLAFGIIYVVSTPNTHRDPYINKQGHAYLKKYEPVQSKSNDLSINTKDPSKHN